MRPHRGGPAHVPARARRARHPISRPVAAGIAALVAYGWWFTDRQPFSGGALLAMVGAAAVLIAAGTSAAVIALHGRVLLVPRPVRVAL